LRWNTGIPPALPKTYDGLVRVESASRLYITPRSSKSGSHFNGYLTAAPISFIDAAARLGVVAVPHGNAEVIFAVVSDTGWVGFRIKNREIYLQTQLGGIESHKTIPFDANECRYLRMIHSSYSQLIAWQTSRDCIQWTTLRSESPFLRLENVTISEVAGTDETVQSVGMAIFDTFEYVKQ